MKAVFLSNLSKRERLILFLTVSVSALAVVYVSAVEPLSARFNKLNSEITLKKRKLEKIYQLLGHREKIETEYEKLVRAAIKENSDEEIIASILNQMEAIARGSGVQINNVRPDRVKEEAGYKRLSIEVSTESNTDALFKFIYNLETSPALLKIERLQISPSRKQDGLVEATFSIVRISFA